MSKSTGKTQERDTNPQQDASKKSEDQKPNKLCKGDLVVACTDHTYDPNNIGIVLEVVEGDNVLNGKYCRWFTATVYWQREQKKEDIGFSDIIWYHKDKEGNETFRKLNSNGRPYKSWMREKKKRR